MPCCRRGLRKLCLEAWRLAAGVGMWRNGGLEDWRLAAGVAGCAGGGGGAGGLLELPESESGKVLMGFGTATALSAAHVTGDAKV